MGLAQPAYPPRPETTTTRARPQPRDPAAGFERRALPLDGRELLPMAFILLLISAITAATILYLSSFGSLTARGNREQQLDHAISQYRGTNAGLAGEVAELQRKDRIEREARRLGFPPVKAADTMPMEVEPGAVDAFEPAPAPAKTRISRR